MRHEQPSDETRELASLYALGTLEAAEARAFEEHLAECAVCRREVESFRNVTQELAFLSPSAATSRQLRDEILSRARAERDAARAGGRSQIWKEWKTDTALPGWFTLRGDEGTWDETDIPGIRVRRLFVDREKDTVTMLVRMAAGTSYPPHRHGGAEECFVLEGDLHVGDVVMRAGDYQRVESSSVHGVQSTDGGCTLFIVSSLHDELIG